LCRPIEALIDGERRRRGGQKRVAVGLRLRDDLGADVSGGAGTVLDDDRLTPAHRKLLGHDPRDGVRRGPGRKRHDDLDQSAGIAVLRRRGERRQGRHPVSAIPHQIPHHLLSAFMVSILAFAVLPEGHEPAVLVNWLRRQRPSLGACAQQLLS
jgi:hypothetical protein